MEEVTKRNFLAVQQAVNSLESRFQEQTIEYNTLLGFMSEIMTELSSIKQQVAILRASSFGTGPTVRS